MWFGLWRMNEKKTQEKTNGPRVVDALPALPNKDIPVGTVLKLSINNCLYRCEGDRWAKIPEEE
ncbi:MAG UNVERIFIED_CONTAM: hypothetical protein LOD86_03540 [Thermobifida fusca]